MSRWFRYHSEALDDPKVQKLSGDLFKAWVNLLCLAARGGGKIKCDDVAFGLRATPALAAKIMVELGQAGLMDAHDSYYVPHNWDKRQYKSDVSNERVKRHRKKECNVTSTVTVTPPDTEADTEKKEIDIARAKTPMIRPQAHSLSEDCYRALGIEIDAIPPEWCALAYQIEMMLSRGYDPPNILGVADRLGRHRPLKPMNYFVKCVESSQQNQIKPAGAPNAKSGNVVQAADRLLAKLAYFDEPAPESARVCSGEGQNPIRAISQR